MNKELLELRHLLISEYKTREQLGEFDANARTIALCLESLAKLTTHLIELERSVARPTVTKRSKK